MSDKMNLLIHINAYSDINTTNSPTMNLAKWTYDSSGLNISNPESKSLTLQAGQSLSLFSGLVAISDSISTTYDIALKVGTSNTYTITHNSGTAPAFRAARSTSADATTQITITKNGNLLTFTSTAGTALSLIAGGVIIGDEVRIAGGFVAANKGKFKILALTATSFQIENSSGQAEGPITLGVGFATAIQIFSANGVQVGNNVDITSGFSSVSFGSYDITDVNPNYIEIYSFAILPTETAVLTQLKIYSMLKQFLYIESNKKLSVTINAISAGTIDQLRAGTVLKKGILLRSSIMYEASVKNVSNDEATIFYVTAE